MALSVGSKVIKNIRAVTLLAAAGLLAMPSLAKAQEETFSQVGAIPIPGLTSFDISWVDATYGGGTYFLADRSNKRIDSFNIPGSTFTSYQADFAGIALTSTGTVNNDLSGPDGVLTFLNPTSGHTEIWAGDGPQVNLGCPAYLNGTCSAVKVVDTSTTHVSHVIPTNGAARADELCHDSVDNVVLIANDAEHDFSFGTPFISFISTATYKIVNQMLIPQATNGIEQCVYDHTTGLFFINLPEVNGPGNDTADGEVLAISPTTFQVVATYIIPTAQCAGPQGMALGPEPQLLLGCNAVGPNGVRNVAIINKHTGVVLSIGWGLGGSDEVWFNPADSHYYITGSSATPQQLSVVDGTGAGAVDQIIPLTSIDKVTQHSVAADPTTLKVFLPAAGGVQIFAPTALDTDDVATPPQPE